MPERDNKPEASVVDETPTKRTRKKVSLPDEVLTIERPPVNILTQSATLAPQAITDRVL